MSQGFGSSGSNAVREEDWVAGELEGVLYIQSLILFAPQAVPAEAHLPMLLPPLASRHPALRRAAAATLRHLAEKSPSVMLPARLEKLLFNALDAEVDIQVADGMMHAPYTPCHPHQDSWKFIYCWTEHKCHSVCCCQGKF